MLILQGLRFSSENYQLSNRTLKAKFGLTPLLDTKWGEYLVESENIDVAVCE